VAEFEIASGVLLGSRGASARVRAGRIVELRVRRLAEPRDVHQFHAEVSAAIRRAGPGVVICGDFRGASPVCREVAREWARSMRASNRGIVKSGLLIDPSNTMFNLQVERVVRCAVNPARRLFANIDELRDWVGASLSESDRGALRHLFSSDET
jgi:hypothetical protein